MSARFCELLLKQHLLILKSLENYRRLVHVLANNSEYQVYHLYIATKVTFLFFFLMALAGKFVNYVTQC